MVHGLAAVIMYAARRYNDAIRLGERALELHPDFVQGLIALGFAHSRLGHHDRAIALFEKIVSLSGRAPLFLMRKCLRSRSKVASPASRGNLLSAPTSMTWQENPASSNSPAASTSSPG